MNIRYNIIEILVLTGIFILLLYSSDAVIYPDSNRYLTQNLHDPPLYSTLININKLIFGNLNSLIIFQSLLIGLSIIYFSKTLTIHFNIDTTAKVIIVLFLFLPILQFYNFLLTEPISYAFSILLVCFVIKLINNLSIKNIFWTSVLTLALLLTRNQFMFLYLVILFLYVGIFFINRSKRTFKFLIISFLSIFIIHNSLVILNEYKNNETFEKKNVSSNNHGVFFFTFIDAIYISTSTDSELFNNEKLRETVYLIFKEMEKKKTLIKYYDNRGHFGKSLKEIRNYSDTLLSELALKQNTTIIKLKKKISVKLISVNFKTYLRHIFKKFYDSTWLFVFLPFLMLLAGLISFLKNKSNYSLLISFLSFFTICNHSIIYLFGRVQPRYFIYTDFILLVFVFITFLFFLKKEKINY